MKKYIIEWKSVDPQTTVKAFLSRGHGLEDVVKVLHSSHVVGQARGVLLVETDHPSSIQKTIVHWDPSLECTVSCVLTDEEVLDILEY